MKIYVASSWRNEYQSVVVKYLRKLGHEVYDFKNPSEGNTGFHWSEIDPLWQNWQPNEYVKCLSHPIAEQGFKSDFDAMKWADCCVLVLPCGRSAHTEAGVMKGWGKTTYVFMPIAQEPELMYKIYDRILTEFDQLKTIPLSVTPKGMTESYCVCQDRFNRPFQTVCKTCGKIVDLTEKQSHLLGKQ